MELVKKIDIHVHTTESTWFTRFPQSRYATPTELIDIYDQISVEKGVILPCVNAEDSFNLSSNYEIKNIVDKYPERFAWFCNIDARQGSNSCDTNFTPYIQVCKENGAKGVGEMCANLYFDDPRVFNLFKHCEQNQMPVTFHIGDMGNDYGLVDEIGLPRLEKALKTFPNLRFLGHSQKFWAEISSDVDEEKRRGYPKGKVLPGGRVVELMRRYPNLCGDLSAVSGYNAVSRDPDFGYSFMEEFQDRLYYGTDICSPEDIYDDRVKLSAFLDDGMLSGKLSYEAYYKISRGNAEKLLKK